MPGNEANFLPHLATFGSLLIDSECGKKESKHSVALVEVSSFPGSCAGEEER